MPSPLQDIEPAVGRSRPEIVLSVVVLPAPLPPIKATISPTSTLNEMPLRTSMWPSLTLMLSTLSILGPPAEMGLDHLWIALNLTGRAFRDLAAEVEHPHALADLHDEAHIVFDQQDGDAAGVQGCGQANDGPQPSS